MDVSKIARLSILVAEAVTDRRDSIADAVRAFGARDVAEVRSLSAALAWLGQHTVDILVCGERLEDQHGAVLLDAARRASPATRALLLPDDALSSDLPGALELPARQSVLKMMLESVLAPAGGFWCEVPDLSLPDILQLYHQSRRSITVLVSGQIAGRIRLESGELVHAETGSLVGVPALCRLLAAKAGLVRTEMSIFDGLETISAPFHGLMLEAMAQLDDRPSTHATGTAALDQDDLDLESLFPSSLEQAAQQPEVESHVIGEPRPKRRRSLFAVAGALATLLVAGAFVMYLAGRGEPPASEAFERDAHAASPVSSSVASIRPAAQPAAAAPADPPVDAPKSTFELHISSVPSRASVTEGGKLLGVTPLSITCERSQIERTKRQFVVSSKGYEPRSLSQGESDTDVQVSMVLTPVRSVAPAAPAPPASPVSTTSAAKELGIRLQR